MGNALAPFAYGMAFAFLLCPLYNVLNKKLNKILSSFICLLAMLAICALFALLLIPQVVDSVSELISKAPELAASLDAFTEGVLGRNPNIGEIVSKYYSGVEAAFNDWFEDSFIPNISNYLSAFSSGLISVVLVFKNCAIGLIVMVYFLNMKDVTKCRAIKMVYGLLPLDRANLFIEDCRYTYQVFNDFLIGKIIDSAIIGLLTFIVTYLLQIPYAALVSIIVGVTNIIPFFGPFIGAIPCALLILVVSPVKCLIFIAAIFIIQQLDGNIIGPKILGQKVGVSSFWVLFSILFFGGLFGFVGMIIAVPVFAVIYRIVKRHIYKKLSARDLSTDTEDYIRLEKIDEETKEYIRKNGKDTTGDMER